MKVGRSAAVQSDWFDGSRAVLHKQPTPTAAAAVRENTGPGYRGTAAKLPPGADITRPGRVLSLFMVSKRPN